MDREGEIELKRCPVCNHKLSLTKETFSAGTDGSYRDWVVECPNCRLLRFEISADCFYGREYAETRDDAVEKFNYYISKFV